MQAPQPQPSAEEKLRFEQKMEEEHTLTFKFKELIVMFNILTKMDLKYGDAMVIQPLVQKLEPFVAVESNIDTPPKNHIVGTKES